MLAVTRQGDEVHCPLLDLTGAANLAELRRMASLSADGRARVAAGQRLAAGLITDRTIARRGSWHVAGPLMIAGPATLHRAGRAGLSAALIAHGVCALLEARLPAIAQRGRVMALEVAGMAAKELFPASLAAHSFLLLPVGRTGAAGIGANVTACELLAAHLGTLRSARRRLVTADSHLVLATGVRDEHRHTAADLLRNSRQMARD